jgi:hypothetical protein
MTHKLLRAWGEGCIWQVLLRIGITFGVLALIGACVTAAALIPLPRELDRNREWLVLGALILPLMAAVGLTMLWAVWMLWRRQTALDGAFAPLGLPGRAYIINGRQYHGQVQGRQVDAYFYRGPNLDIYVSTPLKTRFSVGEKDAVGSALAGALNRTPFTVPELEHLSLYALDEAWARAVFADRAARDALLALLAGGGRLELRQVHLQPEAFSLRLIHAPLSSINAESVARWVTQLIQLARAVEALPPPAQAAEASGLESRSRSNRDAFLGPALLIVFGLLGGMSVCFAAIVGLILLLEAR